MMIHVLAFAANPTIWTSSYVPTNGRLLHLVALDYASMAPHQKVSKVSGMAITGSKAQTRCKRTQLKGDDRCSISPTAGSSGTLCNRVSDIRFLDPRQQPPTPWQAFSSLFALCNRYFFLSLPHCVLARIPD